MNLEDRLLPQYFLEVVTASDRGVTNGLNYNTLGRVGNPDSLFVGAGHPGG
jgi:hypothetical protein